VENVFSLKEPALHKDLSLPEGNQACVFGLLLIAHVSLNFCLEIESESTLFGQEVLDVPERHRLGGYLDPVGHWLPLLV